MHYTVMSADCQLLLSIHRLNPPKTDIKSCFAEEALSAVKYNSLLTNILDTGWPWKYNVEREDFLGRATMQRGDKVYATYILELPKKYNLMIGILEDTAGEPMFVAQATDVICSAVIRPILSEGVQTEHDGQSRIISESDAEVIEYIVNPDSRITKAPVRELNFPKDAVIGGIIRGGETFIAVGDTRIKPYDRVVIFALPSATARIEKFFA